VLASEAQRVLRLRRANTLLEQTAFGRCSAASTLEEKDNKNEEEFKKY
jgi:hypothetical protein